MFLVCYHGEARWKYSSLGISIYDTLSGMILSTVFFLIALWRVSNPSGQFNSEYNKNILLNSLLTAISLHADIDNPVPSICLRAYSFVSNLKLKLFSKHLLTLDSYFKVASILKMWKQLDLPLALCPYSI